MTPETPAAPEKIPFDLNPSMRITDPEQKGPRRINAHTHYRRLGRELAVQFLYELDMLQNADVQKERELFWQQAEESNEFPANRIYRRAKEYANGLIDCTLSHQQQTDALIQAAAENWKLNRIIVIVRAILRVAITEFRYMPERVPAPVCINEAVEICRTFCDEDSVTFVNGVLDAVNNRTAEVSADEIPAAAGTEPLLPAVDKEALLEEQTVDFAVNLPRKEGMPAPRKESVRTVHRVGEAEQEARQRREERERRSAPMHARRNLGERRPQHNPDDENGEETRRDFNDRPRRDFGDRPKRDFGDRPRRDFGDRPKRDFGDRPHRDFGDRPHRDFGDRPKRDFGDRPRRDFGDRPKRDFGDRPKRDFGDRPKRDFGDRPRRDFGDRPRRDFGDRPKRDFGDRPRRDFGDRPRRDFGDRPQRDFGDRPKRDFGDRPHRDFGDRPRRDFGDRPRRDFGDRPKRDFGDRPKRDFGDRPRRDFKPRTGGAPHHRGPRKDEE